jgi:2-dehydropantoate 2-reductase
LTSWQEHADAINRDGLMCQWTDGTTELVSGVRARSPFRAAEVVSEAGGPFDLALVLVKGPATAAAGELAARLLSGANADGALLTLQNGAGNVRVLRQATSSLTPVLVGVTYHGAMAPAPGQVIHTGKGATVLAVSTDEDNDDGEIELRRVWAHRIASLLQSAGMECTVEESAGAAQALIWDKLMVNAAINPVCALLDIRNGELLAHPGALEIAEKAATEVSVLADALSKRLPETLHQPKREVEAPAVRVRRVLQATSSNICSMLADVRRGVPTEVHSITGHVVSMGREMNISTPTNERLLQEMLRLESWSVHALAGRGSLLQPYRTDDATLASPIRSHRAAAVTPAPRPAWMSRGMCTVPRLRDGPPVRQASRSMASATGVRRTSADSTVAVLPTFHELRTWRRALHPEATVGFVPTMGALHEAHLSLVDAARRDCDVVVASVYVNPAQFAANEDLSLYPRTFEQDLAKLSERGVDAVFCPSDTEMYPDGTTDVQLRVIHATELAEGASRPHFFDGVALVCSKLFNLVQPHRAYFGEKGERASWDWDEETGECA